MAQYAHVLVAVEHSAHAVKVARRAADIAQGAAARLTLVHVIDYFPEDLPLEDIAPEDVDPKVYLEERSNKMLDAVARAIGRDDAVRRVVFSSRAARHEVVKTAEEQGVDLIVVGAHVSHGVRAYLGSTANAVVQGAPCDVLIVRSATE